MKLLLSTLIITAGTQINAAPKITIDPVGRHPATKCFLAAAFAGCAYLALFLEQPDLESNDWEDGEWPSVRTVWRAIQKIRAEHLQTKSAHKGCVTISERRAYCFNIFGVMVPGSISLMFGALCTLAAAELARDVAKGLTTY